MNYLRDQVIILRTEPFREQDARVTMFGRDHGKLEAVARGIRTSRAKQGGHIDPLTQASVMVAKGASFDKLAVARMQHPPTVVRRSIEALAIAGSYANLVDELTRPGVPEPGIYDLLAGLVQTLELSSGRLSAARGQFLYHAACLKLLDVLGYSLDATWQDGRNESERRLISFAERGSFDDFLRITAPVSLFDSIGEAVREALRHTHLSKAPHGTQTIAALLH